MSFGYAVLGGLVGGGVVVGLLALASSRSLNAQVQATIAEASREDARAALARDARIVSQKLRNYAEQYANEVAETTAAAMLRDQYGLSSDRIRRLEVLAERYG